MKISQSFADASRILAGVAVLACLGTGCKRPGAPAAAGPPVTGAKTNLMALASAAPPQSYASVFEDLPSPKGRDPFFPDSHRRDPAPAPVVMAARKAAVASDLLLKGIVGSATHRLAVINNAILEIGEEAPVRVSSGQVRVRCMEIGDDYVVISVDGDSRSQRLEMNKK